MEFQGLHHVAIKTSDLGKTLDFYCGILGLEVEERFYDSGEEAEIVFLSLETLSWKSLLPIDQKRKKSTSLPLSISL